MVMATEAVEEIEDGNVAGGPVHSVVVLQEGHRPAALTAQLG